MTNDLQTMIYVDLRIIIYAHSSPGQINSVECRELNIHWFKSQQKLCSFPILLRNNIFISDTAHLVDVFTGSLNLSSSNHYIKKVGSTLYDRSTPKERFFIVLQNDFTDYFNRQCTTMYYTFS